MTHPRKLENKNVKYLNTIKDALIDLIRRNYNSDIGYRYPTDEPVKAFFKGDILGTGLMKNVPCVAVHFSSIRYSDAGQDAGSDGVIDWKIQAYIGASTFEPRQTEIIRLVSAIRRIIIDNPTIPNAGRTIDHVADLEPEMTFTFTPFSLDGDKIDTEAGLIEFSTYFAETGY